MFSIFVDGKIAEVIKNTKETSAYTGFIETLISHPHNGISLVDEWGKIVVSSSAIEGCL